MRLSGPDGRRPLGVKTGTADRDVRATMLDDRAILRRGIADMDVRATIDRNKIHAYFGNRTLTCALQDDCEGRSPYSL